MAKATPLIGFSTVPAKEGARGEHGPLKLMRVWVKNFFHNPPRPWLKSITLHPCE